MTRSKNKNTKTGNGKSAGKTSNKGVTSTPQFRRDDGNERRRRDDDRRGDARGRERNRGNVRGGGKAGNGKAPASQRGGSVQGVRANWRRQNTAEREGYGAASLPGANSTKCRHVTSETMRYAATLADCTQDMTIMHPTVNPTYPAGMVSLQRFKAVEEVLCNSTSSAANGFSWMAICPGHCGPYGDRVLLRSTGEQYNGSVITANFPTAGLENTGWADSPYFAAGSTAAEISYRMTACTIRIRNVTPDLYRGGSIVLYEVPGHNLGALVNMSWKRMASLRGSTLHDLDIKGGEYFEMNWHPQAPETGTISNGEAITGTSGFSHQNTSEVEFDTAGLSELAFMVRNPTVSGAIQAQTLEVTVHAVYELRGTLVHAKELYRRDADGSADMDALITDVTAVSGSLDSSKTWHDQTAGPVSTQVSRYINTVSEIATAVAPIATDVLALIGAL